MFRILQKKYLDFVSLSITIFAIACSGTACNYFSASKAKTSELMEESKQKAEVSISITKTSAVVRELPTFINATGSLSADETSDVASPVSGKVLQTYANVGQYIAKGAVILRLDDNDARLRLQESKAGVLQAQAAVKQAEARVGLLDGGNFQAAKIPEVLAANANYEQVLAELKQAEANEKRYRELVETGDVAMVLYEQYRTSRDTARARVNSAKQQLLAAVNTAKQSNQVIKSAQAGVESAKTQIAVAEKAIADTVIRAPYSGFVSARQVAIGENVTTATPILTLLRTNPLKAQLQINERDVAQVRIGMSVSFQVEAYKDRRFAGTISAINPSLNANSRSATVEVSAENGENLLRSGMFATARILREGGNKAVFIPKSAILYDPNTQSSRSFVIIEGIAKLRVVQIGDEENDEIQIVSGINADEIIATSNLDQLYEGAKVNF